MKSKKNLSINYFINQYLEEVKSCLDKLDFKQIEAAINLLLIAYKSDRNVYIIGNGGSAATASHFSCDLGKGTLRRIYDNSEKRLRVMSLTDNSPLLTALANDISFEDIFVQQLRNLIKKDDILIVISGSGNSKNVIKAVKYAKKCNAKTIGLLGFTDGGKLGKLVDCAIITNSNHYGPIEDTQLILSHLIASWIAKVKAVEDGKKIQKKINKSVPFS